MRQLRFVFCILIFNSAILHPQSDTSQILMTIDNEAITKSDFLKVYNKNIELVLDKDQRDFDYYLNLFINYKLKLAEAKLLGYDQKESYLKEFNMHKEQLSKAYMTDQKVSEALLREAYERTKNEVYAQHILVRLQPGQDTLKAYNKIKALRSRFQNEEFSDLQNELHNGKSIFVEDLGYFSAFKMVYDFENMAFGTPVDSISEPFKTQFGYHVLKVIDKRPSRGQVEVAHIMVSNTKRDSTIVPEKRIRELHRLVIQGEDFESLAKQFSDDKSSAMKGGVLRPFKSGEINSEIFVETAFKLENVGDISNPIETQFGWHIIKLLSKRPVSDYESLRASLEQNVKRDSRSQMIRKSMLKQLRSSYNINEPFREVLGEVLLLNENIWTLNKQDPESVLLTIEEEEVTFASFLSHLRKIKKVINSNFDSKTFLDQQYNTFLDQKILDYKKNHLAEENSEYADVLQEYKDGLVLFDLMQDKIWNAAKNDSLGLHNHYKSNLEAYTTVEKIKGTIVNSSQKKALKSVKSLWTKGQTNQAISKKLNAKKQTIIMSSGTFDVNDSILPSGVKFTEGTSEIISNGNNYVILKIEQLIPESIQPFETVKGQVISDYQKRIETQWIESLREKFQVRIDAAVLKNLKQNLK